MTDVQPRSPSGAVPALINLTYISECLIAAASQEAAIAALLATARRRNGIAHITGALLFTGTHFVQTLEGMPTAVDGLMERIEADPRHEALEIVDRRAVDMRNFGPWSMVYHGPSLFVSAAVTRALMAAHGGKPHDAIRLVRLVRDFSLLPVPPAVR